MAAVTARHAPLGVADARRSPPCRHALRLDRDASDSALGDAGLPLAL